jgi:hypothetical protein
VVYHSGRGCRGDDIGDVASVVIAGCIIYLALAAVSLSMFEPIMNSNIPMFLGIPLLLAWLLFWMVGVPVWVFHQRGWL